MTTHVTDEVLGQLARKQHEIFRRLKEGTLKPNVVLKALQDVIEGKLSVALPPVYFSSHTAEWYDKTPQQQIDLIKELNEVHGWGFKDTDFPSVPESFQPHSANEVLLLDVKLRNRGSISGLWRTFKELAELVKSSDGQSLRFTDALRVRADTVYLIDGYRWKSGIRWVGFDPSTYKGLSPEEAVKLSANNQQTLAGTEILSALLIFPRWLDDMAEGVCPFPQLSALRLETVIASDYVPYLTQWGYYNDNEAILFFDARDENKEVGGLYDGSESSGLNSPVIRVLTTGS